MVYTFQKFDIQTHPLIDEILDYNSLIDFVLANSLNNLTGKANFTISNNLYVKNIYGYNGGTIKFCSPIDFNNQPVTGLIIDVAGLDLSGYSGFDEYGYITVAGIHFGLGWGDLYRQTTEGINILELSGTGLLIDGQVGIGLDLKVDGVLGVASNVTVGGILMGLNGVSVKTGQNGIAVNGENGSIIWFNTTAHLLTISQYGIGENGNGYDGLGVDGNLVVGKSLSVTGWIGINVATGNAPLTVNSTTLCANLNADYLNGYHASHFMALDINGYTPEIAGLFFGSNWGGIYRQTVGGDKVLELSGLGIIIDGYAGCTRLTLSVANGTAPIGVNSSTVCINLNADLLDGYDASHFMNLDAYGYIPEISGIHFGSNWGDLYRDTVTINSVVHYLLKVSGEGLGVNGYINASSISLNPSTGIPALSSTSATTVCTNINADLLDGHHWSDVPSAYSMDHGGLVAFDWNTLTDIGTWGILPYALNWTGYGTGSSHFPTVGYPYGHLFVSKCTDEGIQQTYYAHSGSDAPEIYTRTGWDEGNWTAWAQVLTTNSIYACVHFGALATTEDREQILMLGRYNSTSQYAIVAPSTNASQGLRFINATYSLYTLTIDNSGNVAVANNLSVAGSLINNVTGYAIPVQNNGFAIGGTSTEGTVLYYNPTAHLLTVGDYNSNGYDGLGINGALNVGKGIACTNKIAVVAPSNGLALDLSTNSTFAVGDVAITFYTQANRSMGSQIIGTSTSSGALEFWTGGANVLALRLDSSGNAMLRGSLIHYDGYAIPVQNNGFAIGGTSTEGSVLYYNPTTHLLTISDYLGNGYNGLGINGCLNVKSISLNPATGIPAIASNSATVVCTNINADLLDGHHWADVPSAWNGGTVTTDITIANTNPILLLNCTGHTNWAINSYSNGNLYFTNSGVADLMWLTTSGDLLVASSLKINNAYATISNSVNNFIRTDTINTVIHPVHSSGYLYLNYDRGAGIFFGDGASHIKANITPFGTLLIQSGNSDTIGSGSRLALQDSNTPTKSYDLQLSLAGNLDFWSLTSGVWHKRATLDNSGNLAIAGNLSLTGGGQTSLQGYAGIYANPSAVSVQCSVENSVGQEGGFFAHQNGNFYIGSWAGTTGYLTFRVNNNDTVSIDTNGNLQTLGTISANGGTVLTSNQLYFDGNVNASADLYINYNGYLGGIGQYRNLGIYNGKAGMIVYFTGTSSLFYGNVGVGGTLYNHFTGYSIPVQDNGFKFGQSVLYWNTSANCLEIGEYASSGYNSLIIDGFLNVTNICMDIGRLYLDSSNSCGGYIHFGGPSDTTSARLAQVSARSGGVYPVLAVQGYNAGTSHWDLGTLDVGLLFVDKINSASALGIYFMDNLHLQWIDGNSAPHPQKLYDAVGSQGTDGQVLVSNSLHYPVWTTPNLYAAAQAWRCTGIAGSVDDSWFGYDTNRDSYISLGATGVLYVRAYGLGNVASIAYNGWFSCQSASFGVTPYLYSSVDYFLRCDTVNTVLHPVHATGQLYLSFDRGNGVNFGNGAASVVARITSTGMFMMGGASGDSAANSGNARLGSFNRSLGCAVIELGGSITTPTFEVINKEWTKVLFSVDNTGLCATYSNLTVGGDTQTGHLKFNANSGSSLTYWNGTGLRSGMGVGNGIMTSGDFYVNGACELAGMLQLSAGTASVYLIWSGAGVLTVGSSLTNFWYGTSNGYTGYFGAMDIGAVFSQYVNPIGSVKEVIINAFSSAGDHLVNTTDYAPALHINANGHTTNWGGNIGLGYFDGYMIMNCGTAGCLFTNNGTAIAAVDGSGNYSKISSIKYKTNIDYNVNCDWIYTLKPCTFDWKEPFNGVDQIGLIAEETAEIRKDLVHYNLTGEPDSVYYDKLAIPMLVEMKRLYEEINKLKVELTQLQEEVRNGGEK